MKDEYGNSVSYCMKCGARMLVVKEKDEGWFSPDTGEWHPNIISWYRCPNKKIFFDDHDSYNDREASSDMLV